MAYNEIKQNFIDNFFNKIFVHSTVSVKNHIFEKMNTYCPFKIVPGDDYETLTVIMGDGINLEFNVDWVKKESSNLTLYTLNKIWFNKN